MDWAALAVAAVIFLATLIRSSFGFGEALVAVPLLAVVMVLVRRILIDRVYGGQGFDLGESDKQGLREAAPAGPLTAADHP